MKIKKLDFIFIKFWWLTSILLLNTTYAHDESEAAKKIKNGLRNVSTYLSVAKGSFSNPGLRLPFLLGPIHPGIPHLRANTPLGHGNITKEVVENLTKVAKTTPNGLATLWYGPLPMFYIADNETRRAIVRESHIGSIDAAAAEFVINLTGGNNIMRTFPAFRPIDSQAYKDQRKHLLNFFHGGAKDHLPQLKNSVETYFSNYCEQYGDEPRLLREFLSGLELHTSSQLLGLKQAPLDCHYFKNSEFRKIIERTAHYGISQKHNEDFENKIYRFFLEMVKNNFESLKQADKNNNLIRNIFASLELPFPDRAEDLEKIPKEKLFDVAMNFAATGLGGLMHSTINTLDWAIARLLQDKKLMNEFANLMAKNKELNLADPKNYDKNGALSAISDYVLRNVFLYPAFSHEFFLSSDSFDVKLPHGDNETIDVTIPSKSLILVNYAECNRSHREFAGEEAFCKSLSEEETPGRFVTDNRYATFGGSDKNKDNNHSRRCPGAKTSLYKQMIAIATLFRDYRLEVENPSELVCDEDSAMHPLCSRLNRGKIAMHQLEYH